MVGFPANIAGMAAAPASNRYAQSPELDSMCPYAEHGKLVSFDQHHPTSHFVSLLITFVAAVPIFLQKDF
jgi:hypothetical protein